MDVNSKKYRWILNLIIFALFVLQNVIDKVEAVHARMKKILRSEEVFG